MPLSLPQIVNVCLFDNPTKCCKYLVEDADKDGIFHCLKLSHFRKEIDGQDGSIWASIRNEQSSKNDNCSGFPIMKFIEIGYDCP